MKKLLKSLVELLPGQTAMSLLNTMRRMRYAALRQRHRAEQAVLQKLGNPHRILSGPFKDMEYISTAYFGGVIPKILGVYESELADAIEKTCEARPDAIVDIGAAEGYYAIGMTIRNPIAKSTCFEMYEPAHTLIRELAQRNNVADRVSILGYCDLDSLRKSLETAHRPLVISDCEGGEDLLMDPAKVEKLRTAVMIIEIHEAYAPGVSQRIQQRFEKSHNLQIITSRPRTLAELPTKVPLSKEEFAAATDEGRQEGKWYFLVPHA